MYHFNKQPRYTTLTFLSLQFRQPNLDLVMDLLSRTLAGQVGAILGLFLMLQKNNTGTTVRVFHSSK